MVPRLSNLLKYCDDGCDISVALAFRLVEALSSKQGIGPMTKKKQRLRKRQPCIQISLSHVWIEKILRL